MDLDHCRGQRGPLERPNLCRTSVCKEKLEPTKLSGEDLQLKRAMANRSSDDREFITHVEFSTNCNWNLILGAYFWDST